MKITQLKSKVFVMGVLLLHLPLAFSDDAASSQDWKTAQREYVICSINKSDELLHTGGSAIEIAEISTNSCVGPLNAYREIFSAYLLSQLTGSSARAMADNEAEKSAQEALTRTRAAIAERVLKQRATNRPTT